VPLVRPSLCIPLSLVLACVCAHTAGAQASDTARANTPTIAPALATGTAASGEPVAVPATMRAADASRGLEAGDTVRVWSSAGRYTGRLARVTADTLFIDAPGRSDAVLRSEISELHRSAGRGSRTRAMMRGGGVGLVAGTALGLLGGIAAGNVRCEPDAVDCTPRHDSKIRVAMALDGGLIGTLLGVMAGPSLRRTRWERVGGARGRGAAPGVSVAPASGGGVSVGATLKL
jgi:hypothetical protein